MVELRRLVLEPGLASVLSLALVACGGGEAEEAPPAVSSQGPVYVTTLELEALSGEDAPTYLVTADSLAAGSEWNPRSGIEMPSYTFPSGFDRYPSVWLTDGGGTVDRWDLQADGTLRAPTLETTLSTAGLGEVDSNFIWWGAMISPELAIGPNYSVAGQEFVRWNPSRMEIIDTLPLNLPEQAQTNGRIRVRPDGTLLVGYACSTFDESEVLQRTCTGLLVLDAEGTEILGQDEVEGCAAFTANQGWSSGDGTEYFGDGWTALSAEGAPQNPCWLRVLPGATEFDRSFDASQLFEDSEYVRGGFYPLGDKALFRHYPASLNPERAAGVLESFVWSTWDYQSDRPEPLAGPNEWRGTGQDPIRVDGRLFFQDLAGWNAFNACEDSACEERERQTLDITPFYELTENGIERAFSVTGGAKILTIVRAR